MIAQGVAAFFGLRDCRQLNRRNGVQQTRSNYRREPLKSHVLLGVESSSLYTRF